jgi:hypothetical protein
MTAKVYSFNAVVRRKPSNTPVQESQSNLEIFEDVYTDTIDDWQSHAARNALNEFIRKKIPVHARGTDSVDFVGDLNVLAIAESKLGMRVAMLNPEVNDTGGWMVSFHLGKEMFAAPPIMASETYARALNILLFVEFTLRLKKLKRL